MGTTFLSSCTVVAQLPTCLSAHIKHEIESNLIMNKMARNDILGFHLRSFQFTFEGDSDGSLFRK